MRWRKNVLFSRSEIREATQIQGDYTRYKVPFYFFRIKRAHKSSNYKDIMSQFVLPVL